MPKNWSDHEAELRRLYMDEGRTLKDVRKIMSSKFGFDASIRTCRTRFGELGWKKNRSTTDRSDQKQIARSQHYQSATGIPLPMEPDLSSDEMNEDLRLHILDNYPETYDAFNSFNAMIPPGRMEIAEVLHLMKDIPPAIGMQAILSKWQPGGAFLSASKLYISEYHSRSCQTFSPAVFNLMEAKVNHEEKYSLAKACLEADRDSRRLQFANDSRRWGNKSPVERAFESPSWSEAQQILLAAEDPWNSELFLTCSLVVVAEEFLDMYKVQSLELQLLWILGDGPQTYKDSAAQFRRSYIEILKCFAQSRMDIDLSYYKYAVVIADMEQELSLRNKVDAPDVPAESTKDISNDTRTHKQIQQGIDYCQAGIHIV